MDGEGNRYKTLPIGNQIWMAENLKSMKYANGADIPSGTGAGDIGMESEPKYWFANEDNFKKVPLYGLLYTWHAVAHVRNVCPTGWHVPSLTEWNEFITYLGGTVVAGGKMKSSGTIQSGTGLWS